MDCLAFFAYDSNVFSANPALMTVEALSSQDLLERAANDPEAFCEICRAYETPLLRQATLLCGNPTQAQDLAQDTFVAAWKCLRRYNGQCQFLTWLCAILLNRYRNTLRRRNPFLSLLWGGEESDGGGTDLAIDNSPRPDQALELTEEAAQIHQCIQALSPKHQQVIYLRFYVDDSLEGIAAALGCSVGTVKSRLFNALEKLRGMKEINAHSQTFNNRVASL